MGWNIYNYTFSAFDMHLGRLDKKKQMSGLRMSKTLNRISLAFSFMI